MAKTTFTFKDVTPPLAPETIAFYKLLGKIGVGQAGIARVQLAVMHEISLALAAKPRSRRT